MANRILSTLFVLFLCVAFCFVTGCGKKKKHDTSGAGDSIPNIAAEEELMGAGDTSALKEKTSDESMKSFDSKPKGNFDGEFSENGRYVVQVAVSRSEHFANKIAQKLKDEGYPSYTVSVDDPTPDLAGTYQRVRIGNFKGKSVAENFARTVLEPMGYEWWVDNKSNDNSGGGSGYSSESSGASTSSSGSSSYGSSAPAPEPAATTPAAAVTPEPATPASPPPSAVPAASTPAPGTIDTTPAPAKKADDWSTQW